MASRRYLGLVFGAVVGLSGCHGHSDPYEQPQTPLIFEEAFQPGTQTWVNKQLILFNTAELGEIILPEGRLVAGDPLIEGQRAYKQNVPRGRFPVQLAIAQLSERPANAFLRIRFSDADVQRWELALRPGQSVRKLHRDEFYGLAVKSNRVFLSSAEFYENIPKYFPDNRAFLEELSTKFNYFSGFSNIPVAKDFNVIMLESGLGNGVYAGYFGYDKDGKIAAFLLDFYLVPWAATPAKT